MSEVFTKELAKASVEVIEDAAAGRLPSTLDLIQKQKLELAKLRDAFDDAVALLRDWEDYDPDDEQCGWEKRRDEFLAEHEEAGR